MMTWLELEGKLAEVILAAVPGFPPELIPITVKNIQVIERQECPGADKKTKVIDAVLSSSAPTVDKVVLGYAIDASVGAANLVAKHIALAEASLVPALGMKVPNPYVGPAPGPFTDPNQVGRVNAPDPKVTPTFAPHAVGNQRVPSPFPSKATDANPGPAGEPIPHNTTLDSNLRVAPVGPFPAKANEPNQRNAGSLAGARVDRDK